MLSLIDARIWELASRRYGRFIRGFFAHRNDRLSVVSSFAGHPIYSIAKNRATELYFLIIAKPCFPTHQRPVILRHWLGTGEHGQNHFTQIISWFLSRVNQVAPSSLRKSIRDLFPYFPIEFIKFKKRRFFAINNSLRLAEQSLQGQGRSRWTNVNSLYYPSPLLVAHLHPSRTRRSLKFSYIRHNSIVAHWSHKIFPPQIPNLFPQKHKQKRKHSPYA